MLFNFSLRPALNTSWPWPTWWMVSRSNGWRVTWRVAWSAERGTEKESEGERECWSPRLALHAVVKFAVSSVLLRSRCMQHLDASLVLYTVSTMYLSHVSAAFLPPYLPHESAIALIKWRREKPQTFHVVGGNLSNLLNLFYLIPFLFLFLLL